MTFFGKQKPLVQSGEVTIKIKVKFKWVDGYDGGIIEPSESPHFEFDCPDEEELNKLIQDEIDEMQNCL